jgi:hypothetical protein
MKKIFGGKRMYILVAVILLLIILYFVFPRQDTQEKVSEFGKYHGYTEDVYDSDIRTSDFLTLPDGTRLAYDLFIPTKDGVPANGPLPTLFKYTPYNRAWVLFDENGRFTLGDLGLPWYGEYMLRFRSIVVSIIRPDRDSNIWDAPGRTDWLYDMLKSGYAVIVVDRPGTGASFGILDNDPDDVVNEIDKVLDWIADQTWCDGNIGMFGDSIQAQIQFQAASTGNPHLKAILPATTWMDNYSAVIFPGGVPNKTFVNNYGNVQVKFNEVSTPVDSDTDGALLAQARAERGGTSALGDQAGGAHSAPFRDVMHEGENVWIDHHALYPLLDRINRSGVPVYLINGWYDIYARDNFMIYTNLDAPKRLLVRPTTHAAIEASGKDVDYAAEAHRWFDYWLKGIDNGIMDEPPIHYYLQGAEEMHSADVWPLEEQAMTSYYFGPGESTGKFSINDGALNLSPLTDSQAFDAYTVDYSTTTGKNTHWTALAFPSKYKNMKSHDAKSLTYTTPPLTEATNIIGHPIIHLWLSTEAPDLDTFVYLEEVDGKNSTYVTQGILRASHRMQSQAPFENFGLSWFNHFESELQPIPAGEPFELVFDLLPTAYQFSEGNQIRITISFADDSNFDTPILDPAPTLNLLRNTSNPTYVELPVVDNP